MKIKLFINHGRTIAICPDCFTPINVKGLANSKTLVCPMCYPQAYANGSMPMQNPDGTRINRPVPDYFIRKQTVEKAEADGRAYKITYPREWKEIQTLLNKRPLENQNWNEGETVVFLKQENREHGLEA